MTHIKPISRMPMRAQQGRLDIYETIIIILLSVFFSTWDNFPTVIQNLQKLYSKTP